MNQNRKGRVPMMEGEGRGESAARCCSTLPARFFVLLGLCVSLLLSTLVGSTAIASDIYSQKTGQPCAACHTSSVTGALNVRGIAFRDIPDHIANPTAAWEQVKGIETGVPTVPPISQIVVVAVVLLVAVGAMAFLRPRRHIER